MRPGRFIRRLFGRHERRISEAYRAIYFDLDAFVSMLKKWSPEPTRILEVGAGEGSVTERLAAAYPDTDITGIDVDAQVGRLYRGRSNAVHFRCAAIEEFARGGPGHYDLIVLSDVLHHVPKADRSKLLDAIRALLAPGGSFAFKEWERGKTPIFWLSYLSDRWLTGDRISFMSRDEMVESLTRSFGQGAVVAEQRIRPWWNNLSMLVRP